MFAVILQIILLEPPSSLRIDIINENGWCVNLFLDNGIFSHYIQSEKSAREGRILIEGDGVRQGVGGIPGSVMYGLETSGE